MRQLIQAIIALALILILHFIKALLHHDSPSFFFFYNLISCCQLFILWLIIGALLIQITIGKKFSGRTSLSLSFVIPTLVVLIIEVLCSYLLNHPQHIPGRLARYFRIYYSQFDSDTFQGDPRTCKYDSVLFYSIRPNARVLFSNREYADSFIINQKGFRGSEDEILAPEIISVGDSYAMGLGVKQYETYSYLLAQETRMKTLNSGVSSYGTARESIALRSIDTDHVKYIIWQYCPNDAYENEQYLQRHFHYTPPPPSYFKNLQQMNAWNIKYFPGKFSLTILKIMFRYLSGRNEKLIQKGKEFTVREQASNFLEIIKHSANDFSRTKFIVFELDYYPLKQAFPTEVRALLNEPKYLPLSNYVFVVDMSGKLHKSDYYILDGHMNASGHRIVAETISKIILGNTPH